MVTFLREACDVLDEIVVVDKVPSDKGRVRFVCCHPKYAHDFGLAGFVPSRSQGYVRCGHYSTELCFWLSSCMVFDCDRDAFLTSCYFLLSCFDPFK